VSFWVIKTNSKGVINLADKKRTNQTLLNGALILSLASLVVKVIGVIYKIPLSNI